MSVWRYTAVNAAGERLQGELEADSPRAARARLREQGLAAQTLEARNEGPAPARRRPLPLDELVLFCRQFSTLLNAGLSVERALAALREQVTERERNSPSGRALEGVHQDVLAGLSLSAALERQGRAYPGHFSALTRAGEDAGALPQVMERLADQLERGQALRRKVMLALIYPAIVTVVALMVIAILLTYVVPQVVEVFQHSSQALPLLTRVMLFLSEGLRQFGLWIALALAGAAWTARRALALEPARLAWHRRLLALPVLGGLRGALASARFARTLSVLLGSGVPAVAALSRAAAALDDRVFRAAAAQAAERVKEGMALHRALRETGVFPPMLLHLTASGEGGGDLPGVLEQAARQQELMVETRLATLTALLEPLLILVMGGAVLLIVLATLEPIIEMNRLVGAP